MPKELAKEIRLFIDNMPQFSQVADKAMVDMREKACEGSSLHELGIHDPKFARQILQMTSYSMFGFGSSTAGAGTANALEDTDVLRSVLLAYSLRDFLGQELKSYDFKAGQLWEHSMNCGLSSWMIATKTDFHHPEQAFVAAMIHDIGKIVLDGFLYEEREKFVDIITEEALAPVDAERALLGIDHAEAGALLAEKWRFDSAIVEAMRFHHRPEAASEESDLTVFVHLADCMCMSLGFALENDGLLGILAGGVSFMQSLEE